MKKYLIIGNSAAGVSAAIAIRANDKIGNIKIVSNERFNFYGKPLISYYLGGKISSDNIYYYDENFYKSKNIEIILNANVNKIDTTKNDVVINLDNRISYDKLLIATGSNPFIPQIKNLDINKQENVFTFLTYSDSIKIKNKINKNSKIVVAGAGLIGLKAVEGLSDQVASITVIDFADRIMSSILGKQEADIVQSHMEKKFIKFKLQTVINEVRSKNDTVNSVVLSSGEVIDCDVLIIAVGVRPNIAIAKKANIKTLNGIVVNEYMQTSMENIYAAGDCVEYSDFFSGENKVFALWPNASNQGEVAGINMSNNNTKSFGGVFSMNSISFFGLHLISAGIINDYKFNSSIFVNSARNRLRKLNIFNDNLIGFILINDDQRAGIYTSLINDKTKISTLAYDITSNDIGFNVYSKSERISKMFNFE
ncbi:MAG: NAD(P)/FAD-dependent oxidoreductase [Endomicrobium sp.]|jgi:NAD(P)H-nitrite reductase large subunit|nr:NAD(P)/FAD-dependent oxidoreductase [Endomicrobium sp.]